MSTIYQLIAGLKSILSVVKLIEMEKKFLYS